MLLTWLDNEFSSFHVFYLDSLDKVMLFLIKWKVLTKFSHLSTVSIKMALWDTDYGSSSKKNTYLNTDSLVFILTLKLYSGSSNFTDRPAYHGKITKLWCLRHLSGSPPVSEMFFLPPTFGHLYLSSVFICLVLQKNLFKI